MLCPDSYDHFQVCFSGLSVSIVTEAFLNRERRFLNSTVARISSLVAYFKGVNLPQVQFVA